MDPITIAISILMKNPNIAASAVQSATAPGIVDIAKMQGSMADLSKGILTCYHKSANFHQFDVIKAPWERQSQYSAENSAVVRISYTGLTSTQYQMHVAVMAKGTSVRTAVLADTALIPYSKKCRLEEWASAQ